MAQRTCSVDGCDRKHVARDLCSAHWKRAYGKTNSVEVECPMCGLTSTKRNDGVATRRFCSLLCRDLWRVDQPDDPMWRMHEHVAGKRMPRLCPLPTDHPAIWYGSVSSISFSECGWCGSPVCMGPRGAQARRAYCSGACKRRAKKVRRRGREAQDFGFWSWSDFMHIARRFNYRCAYCNVKPDDLLQPDHVIPVSKGGANTVANLLPACAQCNSDKRDLLLEDWNDDRARRGLALRATSWPSEDRRYWHLTCDVRAA